MIKKNLLFFYLGLATLLTLHCQTISADEFIRLGYCKEKSVTVEGADNKTGHCGVATYFPESEMSLYKGNRITSLFFMIGIKGVENFKVFITSDLNKEEYDYVQEVSAYTSNRWNEIVLNTPYEIDGKAVYIGYELVQQGYVLLFTEEYEKSEQYVWRSDKWEKYNQSYAAAIYGVVKGDHLPRYNVDLLSTKIPRYSDTQTAITCSGVIRNKALETVHKLTLNYSINGKETGNIFIENLNIPYREDGSFQIELTKLPEGNAEVSCTVTSINDGQTDIDMTNNTSKVHPVVCSDHFVPRTSLLEVFSTEKCVNCPAGHALLKEVLEDNDRVIEMVHHAGFYTDKFTIPASKEYEFFYGGRLYAPAFMLDRTCFNEEYPELYSSAIPVCGVDSRFSKALQESLSVPAFASVNLTLDSPDNTRQLTIHINGEELVSTNNDSNHRLFVFLTEDNIASNTQSGARDYIHTAVVRRCITDAWGDTITLRNRYEKEYHIEIGDTLNIENLNVVAFVGNVDKNDITNCRIYNAATQKVKSVITGINNTPEEKTEFRLDNGILQLSAKCQNIRIYSIDGICQKTGQNCNSLSLDGLIPGTYVIQIQDANHVSTRKFQLTKMK